MSGRKELELGKRYSWEEIVEAYPDKMVILEDWTMNGGEVESAVLLSVGACDDELDYSVAKDKYVYFTRTTPLEGGNILWRD